MHSDLEVKIAEKTLGHVNYGSLVNWKQVTGTQAAALSLSQILFTVSTCFISALKWTLVQIVFRWTSIEECLPLKNLQSSITGPPRSRKQRPTLSACLTIE